MLFENHVSSRKFASTHVDQFAGHDARASPIEDEKAGYAEDEKAGYAKDVGGVQHLEM